MKKLWDWVKKQKEPREYELPFKVIPLFRSGAITLFPFIFYAKGYRTHCIIDHERYHWHHILKTGIVTWYVLYGVCWLTMMAVALIMSRKPFPAHLHPLEFEPYQLQWECEASHSE